MISELSENMATVVKFEPRSGHPSDEELVRLGFDAIYSAYVPYVAAIGHKLLGRPEEVEDLIQDVFVTVLNRLDSLENPGALKGWLGTITTRRALKRLKRRKMRRFVGLDRYDGYETLSYDGLSADQEVLIRQVFQKLDDMPARWRVVWSLKHLEGKTNAEIAELCDCSGTTVKRDLASARQLLKEVFDDE